MIELAVALVFVVIIMLILCVYGVGEGFNDTCTTLSNGDTDMIKQDRLKGLKYYETWKAASVSGKNCEAVSGKQCMSGGQTVNNVQFEGADTRTGAETEESLMREQFQDFSLMSSEDAAGRINDLDNMNYGWTGKAPVPQQAWSGEQLYRVYHGDLCRGDQRMAEKMKDIGMRAQQSIINRAAFHRWSLEPYVAEELDANENFQWWDDDESLEQSMHKDGQTVEQYFMR